MFVFVILNPNPSLVEFTDIFDNLALTSDIYSIPLESDKKHYSGISSSPSISKPGTDMLRMRRFHPRSVVVLNLPYIGQVADGAAEEITASEARLQLWKKKQIWIIFKM